MGDLRLYAIGIDEVRDFVGADAALREELRGIADAAFAPPAPAQQPAGGLLHKLGPLFRRPPGAVVLPAHHPTPEDFDRLVSGQWVPPDRLGPTWRLFETLVAQRAWGRVRLPLDEAALNRIDFDLCRSGCPASLGLGALIGSEARIGLTPLPGLTVGYRTSDHAVATAEYYADCEDSVPDPDTRDRVRVLVNWLNGFAHWRELAPGLRRPAPDLLAFRVADQPG